MTSSYRTRSHELAHNFALHHSNGNGEEYGNPMGILGGGAAFSPATRYMAGWINQANGAFFSDPADAPTLVSLRALSHELDSGYGRYSAVISDCKTCRNTGGKVDGDWAADGPYLIGGEIVVAYRGPVGNDDAWSDAWFLSKVEVMLQCYC